MTSELIHEEIYLLSNFVLCHFCSINGYEVTIWDIGGLLSGKYPVLDISIELEKNY